jgi:lipoate-protein ligase A
LIDARLLEVGLLPPRRLHASYAGIAQASAPGSVPTLLWGRASAHLSLGQSQSAACELVARPAVPVVRRPLGGGAVWVDEAQWIYAFIVPLRLAPRRPADWAGWALQPALATFQAFGLAVERRGEDLWLAGRKIAGSGAATIGGCAVFASSFLLRFPHARFAECIAGSSGFRAWLQAGLAATLTDWASHAPPPSAATLRQAFVAAVADAFGWQLRADAPDAAECRVIAAAEADIIEDDDGAARRSVAGGIKLNRESRLVEHEQDGRRVRELVLRGMLTRRAVISIREGSRP